MDNNLNEKQLEAVKYIDGSLLILAGAGSGKTKTITTRLAYLISLGINPSSILTLTFTNKAAREMRDRAYQLIGHNISNPPLLLTFHKFGLLFLKLYINRLNRSNDFVIIDSDDKKRIIKTLVGKKLPAQEIAEEISNYKNSLIDEEKAIKEAVGDYKLVAEIYKKYNEYLVENNLVDFDDLLYLTYKILQDNKLAEYISEKYQYIMVDEYQDTNFLQYKILEKLTTAHKNIVVVGDDDQSIYGWRGARIKNILEFEKNFNAKVIKLEKNYRSKKDILDYANKLIEHNHNRIGKNLVSTKDGKANIKLFESSNEKDEACKIANDIKTLVKDNISLDNIAVLFRVNSLSRALEDCFIKENIPYKIIGTIRFYERAEIKDIIAYLRLFVNKNDDFSLKRIINKPKRGIGKVSLQKLEVEAFKRGISIFELFNLDMEELSNIVGKKNARTLKLFMADFIDLEKTLEESKIKFIDLFEKTFEIKTIYNDIEKNRNIDEFYGYFKSFFIENIDLTLDDFLNNILLSTEQDNIEDSFVSLMSIHASKGLEFDYVYIIGLEEGLFPLLNDSDMEEERRLAYVAITRARDGLRFCVSKARFYKGEKTFLSKSRFLSECGIISGGVKISKNKEFKVGDAIEHKVFGFGKILSVKKSGKEYLLKIKFANSTKEILSNFVSKV